MRCQKVPNCSLATAAGEKLSPHVALDTLGEDGGDVSPSLGFRGLGFRV